MGFVGRNAEPASGSEGDIRTEIAVALEPALTALAHRAQRSLDAETALCTASVANLMWKMREGFVPGALPRHRVVIRFRFADEALEHDTYGALIRPEAPAEICTSIPGFEVDLFVGTNAASLPGIILGRTTNARETDRGDLVLSGDTLLARTMNRRLKPGFASGIDAIVPLPGDRAWRTGRRSDVA